MSMSSRWSLCWTAMVLVITLPEQAFAKPAPIPIAYFKPDALGLSERLAGLCIDRNSAVIEQDEVHVLCSRTIDGLQGAFAQVIVGNSYSTTPELKVRFSIVRSEKFFRVQASQWIETQMAFGQVRRAPLDGKKQTENILQLLEGVGGNRTPPHETEPPAP
ncbi:MAG: hypothetical protein ABI898_09345 [Sphingomonadales bacterium]